MKQRAAAVEQKVAGLSKPTVFVEIYSKPLMTAGKATFIDNLVTLAGGTNVGDAAGSGFPTFSAEVLLKDDPDVYIATTGSMASPGQIAKRSGYDGLTGREGRARLRHRRQPPRAPRTAPRRRSRAARPDDPSRGLRLAVAGGVGDTVIGQGRRDTTRGRRHGAPAQTMTRERPAHVSRAARKGWPGLALAAGLSLVCLVVSLSLGPASLSPAQLWHDLLAGPGSHTADQHHLLADPHAAGRARLPGRRRAGGRRGDPPGPVPEPADRPLRHRRVVGRRARGDDRHRRSGWPVGSG